MPPINPNNRLLPSIIDRLTDPEAIGTVALPWYGEREMLAAVLADLNDLLNTRLTVTDIPPEYEFTRRSIVAYGLPDLVRYNGVNQQQMGLLSGVIADIINRYEPRLTKVRVQILPNDSQHDSRSVRFHIDAKLNVDPAPEVGFVTVLELSTGRASVKADGGRG